MSFALLVVLKSILILACAALAAAAWRRGSASTRHAIWALAIVGVLALPVASTLLPKLELSVVRNAPFHKGGAPERINRPFQSEGGVVSPGRRCGVSDHPVCAESEATQHFLNGAVTPPLPGGQFIWALGVLLMLTRFAFANRTAHHIVQESVDVENAEWLELAGEISGRLSIRKPVRLVFHNHDIPPMTWGLFRHVVILPAGAKLWTPARRRLVLTHELTHVQRNDGLMQLFVQLACSVYWFNPVIWYAAHRIRLERERACDDQVINDGTAPEDYAGHLVEIARALSRNGALTVAAISMAQPSQLETRVRSILDRRTSRRRLSRLALVPLLASIALLTCTIAAVRITATTLPLPPVLPAPKTTPLAVPPQRIRIGDTGTVTGVTPPKVVSSAQPPYTPEAYSRRIEGTVTIEASVDTQGTVTILRTLKGLGYGLDENAARALGSWKFVPALRNGVPVDAITQVEVDFRLANDQSMNATLRGTVIAAGVDTRRIPGVAVTATNTETGVVAKVLTDESGTYEFASLKPGTYKVAAELAGFKPHAYNGVPLGTQMNVWLNFALEKLVDVNMSPAAGGPYRIGGDVRPPTVISRVEPQYSPEARAARYQGTVVVGATIGTDGIVQSISIVRSLGMGLDEAAVEALKQWKFSPALKNDTPVPVSLNIEVNFNLR
jgi:TonB family protein